MSTRLFSLCLCLLLVLAPDPLPGGRVAAAESPPGVTGNGTPTAQQVEAARKAVDADTGLDETQKKKALELYDQAGQWLKQMADTADQLAELRLTVKGAPARIKDIRERLTRPSADLPPLDPLIEAADLEQVEQAASREQLALQQVRDVQRKADDELTRLLVGSKDLNEQIASGAKRLEQIATDLKVASEADPGTLADAQVLVLKSRRALRQTELELLKLRLDSHELRTNLAQAERDLAAAETTQREQRLERLTQTTQALREASARQAREEAEALQSRTEALPAPLQKIAAENAGFRQELEGLVGREQAVSRSLQTVRRQLDEVQGDFERTQQRVEVVGATEAIGKMLKRRRGELPSTQSYHRTSAQRVDEIERATDRQIEIDELLRERSDTQAVVQGILADLPQAERERYAADVTTLVQARREALNELQKVYGRYIGRITALDLAERQLVDLASAFVDYIDDQLIWIPGAGIAGMEQPRFLGHALWWLVSPENWSAAAEDLWHLAQQRPLLLAVVLMLFLLFWRKHGAAEQRLQEIAAETRRIRTDSFRLTLRALWHTLVVIGAWPVLLVGLGRLAASLATASPFTLALAAGATQAGLVLLSIRLLIQLCLPNGIGDRHLRWPEPIRTPLAREFRWLLPFAVPLGFLIALGSGESLPPEVRGLGRLAFILGMLVSLTFTYRLLRRNGALMQAVLGAEEPGLVGQLHFIWFPLMMLLPLVFGVTAALGYYQAAIHLEVRAEMTFGFFILLFLLKELLLRSLFIAERRLRLEDALRRRDELRAQRSQEEDGGEDESSAVSLEIPEMNFDALSEQTRRLVRAGFLFSAVLGIWSIWSDLLPALGFLNHTELPLHATRIVDGVSREVPITLGDLTFGLLMVLITVLAAKNIPGVLEIALLQRLPLDPGARYAITSLSQYAIAGIGVVLAFKTLGLQWSNIQWLVAALSVGLGFGLQEIVANFISGIILLFERPIRVGDVVTLDNTTGRVSRIRIRATTITNWDNQELLIPNKEFITGRVINWTLSDKINRVVITVGVAYGSDVTRAMALMREAAEENANILDDPEPITSFEGFGDNALTLVLRSYLGSMDYRLATITALHQAINDKFNAAGINIAFPQRDLHLSAERPLDIRLHRGRPGARGEG